MERTAELEYRPLEECKSEGGFIRAVGFKPRKAPLIILIVGILMLLPNNIYIRILGVFFILMAAFVLYYVKDYKIVDIYEKGVLVFGDDEAKTACFIPFDDIKSWVVSHEDGHDMIRFRLNDDSVVVRYSFEADRAFWALNKVIHEKDEKYLKMLENRGKDSVFSRLTDRIRNVFRRK